MDESDRLRALELINEVQQDCSSVTVQIGGTSDSGQVEHDSLYVVDAPVTVVDALKDDGFKLDVKEGLLRVRRW